MAAVGIYSTLLDHLNVFKKEIEDENIVFKMFTKATFVLFIMCAFLVTTAEFFGTPIICSKGDDMVNAFCWINGAKHVPKAFINGVDEHKLSHWGCKLIKVRIFYILGNRGYLISIIWTIFF